MLPPHLPMYICVARFNYFSIYAIKEYYEICAMIYNVGRSLCYAREEKLPIGNVNAIWKPVAISRSSIGQNDKSVVNEFSYM